jgi:hypothetical protein
VPGDYEVVDLSKSGSGSSDYETVDIAPSRFPAAGEVRQRARKNLARELPKVGQEQQEQIVHESQTKEMVRAAEMLPFAVAAPFTGGASLAAGTAIMAGAGLAGGAGRELLEAGREGKTKKIGALAASLGVDTAMGAGSELGLRAVGALGKEAVASGREFLESTGAGSKALSAAQKGIGVGLTNVRRLMAEAAAQGKKGAQALEEAIGVTRKSLYSEVGDVGVDVSAPLKKALNDFRSLPGGKGAWGRPQAALSSEAAAQKGQILTSETAEKTAYKLRAGISKQLDKMGSEAQAARRAGADKATLKGITDRGREIVTEMERDLKYAQDQISSEQPLNGLIVQQRRIADIAAREQQISPEERLVFKQLASDLETTIGKQIASNPKAVALFAQDKALSAVKSDRTASEEVMRFTVGRLLRGAGYKAAGALTGGIIGERTGGMRGALEGAAIGAGASAAIEHGSIYALRRIVANPEAARMWGQALKLNAAGLKSRSADMAEKAIRSVDGLPQALRAAHAEERAEAGN